MEDTTSSRDKGQSAERVKGFLENLQKAAEKLKSSDPLTDHELDALEMVRRVVRNEPSENHENLHRSPGWRPRLSRKVLVTIASSLVISASVGLTLIRPLFKKKETSPSAKLASVIRGVNFEKTLNTNKGVRVFRPTEVIRVRVDLHRPARLFFIVLDTKEQLSSLTDEVISGGEGANIQPLQLNNQVGVQTLFVLASAAEWELQDFKKLLAEASQILAAAGGDRSLKVQELLRYLRALSGLSVHASDFEQTSETSGPADMDQQDWLCEQEAEEIRSQGKYPEALLAWRKVVASRIGRLGETHGLTAAARSRAEVLEAILRRSKDELQRLIAAEKESSQGVRFLNEGKPRAAKPILDRALPVRRGILGDEHPYTAEIRYNIGVALERLGDYSGSVEHLRAAWNVWRGTLGENQFETAAADSELGLVLDELGRHNEARARHEEDLAEAELLFLQAELALRKISDQYEIYLAKVLVDRASNLDSQSQYDRSLPLYLEAKRIYDRHPGAASLDKALLDVNLGVHLKDLGEFKGAEEHLQRAVGTYRAELGETDSKTVLSLSGLASVQMRRSKHGEAADLLNHALGLTIEKFGIVHPNAAHILNSIGHNFNLQGNHMEALPLLEEALAISRTTIGHLHPQTIITCNNVASTLNALGFYVAAESYWRLSASWYEMSLPVVSRLSFERVVFDEEVSPLPRLAAILLRNGKPREAVSTLEGYWSRGLLEEIDYRRLGSMTDEERERETALRRDIAFLDERISTPSRPPIEKDEGIAREKARLTAELRELLSRVRARSLVPASTPMLTEDIQCQLPQDAALLSWIDLPELKLEKDPRGEHWGIVLRREGEPIGVRLEGKGGGGAWADEDQTLPRRFLEAVRSPIQSSWADLAQELKKQRIAPVQEALRKSSGPPVHEWIILPSVAMTGVPIELLLGEEAGEGARVNYSPSGTLFARFAGSPAISRRDRPIQRALIVADPTPASGLKSAKTGQGASLEGADEERLKGARSQAEALSSLLRRLNPKANSSDILPLYDDEANEGKIAELLNSGFISTAEIISFGVHGRVDERKPWSAELLLAPLPPTQARARAPGSHLVLDGRLTAEEFLTAGPLGAEVVVVGSCESARGPLVGGEGLLGFSQAFLLAGARSVLLTLWKVDETATQLLLTKFYENYLEKGEPKAVALAAAKAWLRGLSGRDVARLSPLSQEDGVKPPPRPDDGTHRPYAHPYFWAGFIIVGDPR